MEGDTRTKVNILILTSVKYYNGYIPTVRSFSLQVGAVIVNRETNSIIGKGWNRVPEGCEEQFSWDFVNKKPSSEKHLYGK